MREQAADVVAKVKPRLRGVIHEYAFFAAIALGALLVAARQRRPPGRRDVRSTRRAICGLFGISALYHRVNWRPPRARAWMRRLDHSMIFVFIAASFTPFALLVLHGTQATTMLAVVWGGALAGVVLSLLWVGAPKWLTAIVYVALGMLGACTRRSIWQRARLAAVAASRSAGRSTRPAPSSTRPSARIPRRQSSATTRSSTRS